MKSTHIQSKYSALYKSPNIQSIKHSGKHQQEKRKLWLMNQKWEESGGGGRVDKTRRKWCMFKMGGDDFLMTGIR